MVESEVKGTLLDPEVTTRDILRAMDRAVADALRHHKAIGNTIAVWDWEKNCVALIPAEQIEIPGEPDDGPPTEPS